MKTRFAVALSMVAGAALGGAAIQALHAQTKVPVYMIAVNEVSDQDVEALEGWRNSPEFQAALNIGEKYAKFNIVAVNGLK